MAETSKIEWTDATVNFWWGCTKVGPGCDHCYAETWDKRAGGAHWGTGVPRRHIASAQDTLAKLNRHGGKRVFIQSMSDLFDNDVPIEWWVDAWESIIRAKKCRIQIVTKRITMVEKRLTQAGYSRWPENAGLMITVCNQAEADRDVPRLLALKAKLGIPWVGLSMEPLLGPVDLTEVALARPDLRASVILDSLRGHGGLQGPIGKLDWVIVGGESGPKARPMHPDWARSLRDQCQAAGVAFLFKQWGEWSPCVLEADEDGWPSAAYPLVGCCDPETHRPDQPARFWLPSGETGHWTDIEEFPAIGVRRVGKARAGRLLDGREWNQMPGALT